MNREAIRAQLIPTNVVMSALVREDEQPHCLGIAAEQAGIEGEHARPGDAEIVQPGSKPNSDGAAPELASCNFKGAIAFHAHR